MKYGQNFESLNADTDGSDRFHDTHEKHAREHHPGSSLGDEVYVKAIDKLRELGIADLVSLPQLVVVGDQSSGKSSVLESLTGFAFPRAPGLCTRYVTQITCRRDESEGIDISIIPGPSSSDSRIEKLEAFKRSVQRGDLNLAEVFHDANRTMGIRQDGNEGDGEDDPELTTFSEDILRIEVNGPDQQHLTVIDVPGIFRTATEGLTTEEDIHLVRNMVTKYIQDSRTIILAVIPCNHDIATQEILKLAKGVDPDGLRTMGVLTKPDLVPERAMQKVVCDLIQGRRQTLRLGYYVVKNRGSDDESCSQSKQKKAEINFFAKAPWSGLHSTGRVGTAALLTALTRLLRGLTKKEFKNVTAEIQKLLDDNLREKNGLGPDRSDPASQREFLGKISTEFQEVARCARQAHYGKEIFSRRKTMRLVTIVRQLNEDFNALCWRSGHTRKFEGPAEEPPEAKEYNLKDELPAELRSILKNIDFECPDPLEDCLIEHIATTFKDSRGPEIGTFNPSILTTVFQEQSKNWEPLVLRHTSRAIVVVHDFIHQALEELCTDENVRDQIWNLLLRPKVCAAFDRAMTHAHFLLEVERHGIPVTVSEGFNEKQQACRAKRLGSAIDRVNGGSGRSLPEALYVEKKSLLAIASDRSDIREDIHDTLKSYYGIALGRVIDSVCQQVVFHFLLNSEEGPLSIFSPKLVFGLKETMLQAIASEDSLVQEKRDRITKEIEKLQKAVEELRFAV